MDMRSDDDEAKILELFITKVSVQCTCTVHVMYAHCVELG